MAFGAKGKQIFTGSTSGPVRLHDASSGKVLREIGTHKDFVHAVAWAPGGDVMASGSDDGVYKLWSFKTGTLLRTWTVTAKRVAHRQIWALVFSRDHKTLYTGMGDGVIRAFSVATGKETRRFTGHGKRVLGLALNAAGTRLASGSGDLTVRVWDLATGKQLVQLGGHAKQIYAVAWHPTEDRWLASGSYDGSVRLWDWKGGVPKQRLDVDKQGVYGLAFSPDGRRLAITGGSGQVQLHARK